MYTRRTFVKGVAATALSLHLPDMYQQMPAPGKRIGIIGLDTSHSTAFTKVLNASDAPADYKGYRVVAAYPYGSKDIESSTSRIAGYSEEVKKSGVEIVMSIGDLLEKVDVVLLETNDGRLHLDQATQVLKTGKRLFIDKPIAASLADVVAIFKTAKKYNVPIFSSSSLRYIKGLEGLEKSQVLGADTFSPATLEKTHPDLFWYGIHGVETLFTVMGRGCRQVVRVHTDSTDVVVGTWADGRIGTFRGTRTGKPGYGGTVYTEKGNVALGPYMGYEPLLREIIRYFETGNVPVQPEETLEIFAFMEAADESKRQGGVPVKLETVLSKVGRL
ncbi:Gfo/Idh/MocA family protein [Spirosoma sp.]|uniref:Gfo/Idh/MocA family protein n=1 Tax=Spirosoma sp. TaxID=1899569 RepID=UPI003B3B0CD3